MENTLKGRYTTTKAFGLADYGHDHTPRFAIVDLDVDSNGIVDAKERKAVKANLYTVALQEGAKPLLDNGVVVGVNSCVNFSGGGKSATNDKVYVFNKGEGLMLTTHYTDTEGTTYTAKPEALTRLSFDALKFLERLGYIQ